MLSHVMATTQENIMLIPDTSDKISQELSDLKLQLNACQQTNASLQLKLMQKEEIVIKTQADSMRESQSFKAEIKKLREQLEKVASVETTQSQAEMAEQLKLAQEKEKRAVQDLNDRIIKDVRMKEVLEDYEKEMQKQIIKYRKLFDIHETVKGNLATLETAFHDVIQKYERTKNIIEAYKANEKIFKENLQIMDKNSKIEQQRYESLKTHAQTQIDKANKDNVGIKQHYEEHEKKLSAIIKRLEIKICSLQTTIDQKNRECLELATLCDEVTGKKI